MFIYAYIFYILNWLSWQKSRLTHEVYLWKTLRWEKFGKENEMFEVQPMDKKFIVVATSRMIGIHRSSVDLRRRPSSAFQSFPIIPNAGSATFPMLALVGNARDTARALKSSEFRLNHALRNSLSMYFH